jgi:hypothetical protein
MDKLKMLRERLEATEKNVLNLTGDERWIKYLILFREYEDYYREMKRNTTIKLTPEEILKQSERKIIMYQFDIDILKERFELIAQELKAFPGGRALTFSDMKMELRALNTEIIAKTDFLEELKFRYLETLQKNTK